MQLSYAQIPRRPVNLTDLKEVFRFVAPTVRNAAIKSAEQLNQLGIRYALAGGLAVGAYGYIRATTGLDFLPKHTGYRVGSIALRSLSRRYEPSVQRSERLLSDPLSSPGGEEFERKTTASSQIMSADGARINSTRTSIAKKDSRLLLDRVKLNPRTIESANEDSLCCLHKVGSSSFRNVHELLRIAIRQREPRTLHLKHDSMSRAKCVCHVWQFELDMIRFTGLKGHRLLEALAILATEWLTSNQLLISAHLRNSVRRRNTRSCRRRWIIEVRIVARINVD